MKTKILRILIVEDSSVVAILLKAIFQQEPDFQVVGHAKDGREGVKMALELKPDVITMDIRMPAMDGFEATRRILADNPVPIIVISASVDNEELRITFRAIEEGALAIVEKPRGVTHPDFELIRRNMVDTVRAMAAVRLFRRKKINVAQLADIPVLEIPQHRGSYELLAIGCSTGGPQVLLNILSKLPKTFPVPIVITQHISKGFVGGLVAWLAGNTELKVKLAEQGESLQAGTIYFAPDDQHLLITRAISGLAVSLNHDALENSFRPSADAMFRSIARNCQQNAIGLLLSGMGEDGAKGMLALRSAGGHTLAQDEASSVVYGMPGAAIALKAVDQVVDLDKLPGYLIRIAQNKASCVEPSNG